MMRQCWWLSSLVVLWCVCDDALSVGIPAGFGPCPEPPVADDFDVNNYVGTWYEYERFPVPFEFLGTCGQATYTTINSTAIAVNNSGIQQFSFAGRTWLRRRTNALGVATIPDPSVPAKLVVRFGNTAFSEFAKGNYWVLDTDYETYSLVYSCSMLPFGFAHYEAAWILTRDRGVAPSNLDFLKQYLRDTGVDPSNFFVVQQSDCDDATASNQDTLYFQQH